MNINEEVQMRILFFSSDNNKTSGAFLCLTRQISILQEQYGVECLVILPYDGDGTAFLEDNHIQYRIVKSRNWIINKSDPLFKHLYASIKMYAKAFLNLKSIKQCEKIIGHYHPDIIHINTTFSYVGAVAAKRKKVPVVWHLRELVEEGMNGQIWNRKYGYWLLGQSARIICVSNNVKEAFLNRLPVDKLSVIYDGIEESMVPFGQQKDESEITMVCVGALGKHKGQEAIIRACAKIKEKLCIPFKLYIIGRGPEEANYHQLIKELCLEDSVFLTGAINNVIEYYNKAHFTIVNGFREGFGRVTVEAMMAGSYVIGCDTGGTLELTDYGKYGLIFHHNDVEDLYEKLKYAFDNKDYLMDQRAAAREYALAHFTSSINASEVYKLYQEVLNV